MLGAAPLGAALVGHNKTALAARSCGAPHGKVVEAIFLQRAGQRAVAVDRVRTLGSLTVAWLAL